MYFGITISGLICVWFPFSFFFFFQFPAPFLPSSHAHPTLSSILQFLSWAYCETSFQDRTCWGCSALLSHICQESPWNQQAFGWAPEWETEPLFGHLPRPKTQELRLSEVCDEGGLVSMSYEVLKFHCRWARGHHCFWPRAGQTLHWYPAHALAGMFTYMSIVSFCFSLFTFLHFIA